MGTLKVSLILGLVGLSVSFSAGADPVGEVRETAVRRGESSLQAVFGPGLVWMGGGDGKLERGFGKTAFGGQLMVLAPVAAGSPLSMGAELMMTFWTRSAGGRESQTAGIHLLPTAQYSFDTSPSAVVRPYVGFSVGPMATMFRIIENVGGNRTDRNYVVFLTALARPGLSFTISRTISLQFEAKAGLMAEALALAPQLTLGIFLEPGRNGTVATIAN